ncbi:MAG: hypothetical protein FJ138_12120 [Deltaproteobacteria bacterium]|nr:hypothetical protein [Deltaproteobacteria bacterium]
MKNSLIVALALVICAISNPSRDAHVDQVKRDFLKEGDARRDGAEGAMEQLGRGLARALGGSMMEVLLEGAEYRDWGVASALVLERKGDNEVLTVGALGQVWVWAEEGER